MANPDIGLIPCPCCGEDAKVRESGKNGRAYMLCTSPVCGFQGFARSDGAHQGMTKRMRKIQQQAAALPDEKPKKGMFDDLAF